MDNNKSNKETTDTPEHKLCCCYSKKSHDMRACGLCYTFCYKPDEIEQCYFCPRYFKEYYESGYFMTKQSGSEPIVVVPLHFYLLNYHYSFLVY